MSEDRVSDELINSFNSRIKNALHRNNIYTTEELLSFTEIDLLHFSGISYASVGEIMRELDKRKLKLSYIPDQSTSSLHGWKAYQESKAASSSLTNSRKKFVLGNHKLLRTIFKKRFRND